MRRALAFALCILLTGCLNHAVLRPYAGQWVLQTSEKNFAVLTTKIHRGKVTGTLILPQRFRESPTGKLSSIVLPIVTQPVTGRWKNRSVELVIGHKPDRNRLLMTMPNNNYVLLDWFHGRVPPWKLERVPEEPKAVVATDWPMYSNDPEVVSFRQQLRTMVEEDQAARKKESINPNEIEELSERARPVLDSIYERYRWPKNSVFGPSACNDFWLLVQHQPLALQEHMLEAMKASVDTNEASPKNYAYLFDRVQVGKGKPQHWGTQSKCENGRAVLYPIDDISNVEQQRHEIGLDTLADSLRASDAICARIQK